MSTPAPVQVGSLTLGGNRPMVLIAGPCVLEDLDTACRIAETLQEQCGRLGIPLIFKGSYDKANRTSVNAYRGPGLEEGLRILAQVKERFGLPVLSDVHEVSQIDSAEQVLDVIQIPAFLCRQTDLLVRAGRSGKVVNVKKGQFQAPWDMKHVVGKLASTGNEQIVLTERGASFGYNNLVVDMRSLLIMRQLGYPVVFDATHAVQLPGGNDGSSGGQRDYVGALSRAAVATGIDGLFWEVYEDPDCARCDGPNSLYLRDLPRLLAPLLEIDALVKRL
ncbi:3-deoxy-8-phosphooctulonate synthase [Desulfuromonas thiophila]|uniref:2-dehydro-3-deoxyphosphooctonate aldolase n=1 Tax=Desulfuromonas thiophila TaxID=57664 RepID=A0A1G7ARP4_9BACT|nr:3-deoxy-8-phosphooctulonate synthase [Desulfuromonas thiophila]SDE17461.1 2-dehydro-3-deoxyphosphooctonate aldolase (KDO 8-P synthase) [Desulfuromonas thiophila]